MGEIVNLRQARKARARTEAERQAANNRAAFGRTKAEREATEARETRRKALLDGVALDGGNGQADSERTD